MLPGRTSERDLESGVQLVPSISFYKGKISITPSDLYYLLQIQIYLALIKQMRLSSLLMENRVKTITKTLSDTHRIPYTHLAKEDLVDTAHRRHRHHFFPMKQQLKPTNSEQMTPTLP
jgi:hypothetical protein